MKIYLKLPISSFSKLLKVQKNMLNIRITVVFLYYMDNKNIFN